MSKKEEIAKLINDLGQTKSKLEELRSGCAHDEGYYVGWWSWRIGAMEVAQICDICQMPTGKMEDEEKRSFLEKEKEREIAGWKATCQKLRDEGNPEGAQILEDTWKDKFKD